KRIPMRGDRTLRDLTCQAVSQKNRPHVDRNLFAIHPVTNRWLVRNWNCKLCWEIDYKFFAEQKKAQQTRIEQERRAGVIHQLLIEANKQGEPSNVEGTPAKETAPAK